VYRIGEFSKISRIPVTALRYYSDCGLLPPHTVDPGTGYRYYSAAQLPRLNRILALKDLGLSLEEIGPLLDGELPPAELRGMLRLKSIEIGHAVAEQQERLNRVEARLRLIESEGVMPDQEVVLKTLDSMHVLSIREVVDAPARIGALIGDGFASLMPAGIVPTAPCFALYHDPEFKPDEIDVEIAFPVSDDQAGAPDTPGGRAFQARTVPGGKAAVTVHHGGYDTIDESYGRIGGWIAENGFRFAGPPQEAYLTQPDDPTGPVTEIRIPVE
jgi:DNA-binding transcriptional MerR regulator/predicted transcriptional regulator YdeE